jgi:dTDP-4-amino-4,6-dideoxygalactose transaminase
MWVLPSFLQNLDTIMAKRRRLHDHYMEAFAVNEQRGQLRLPRIPGDCVSAYHLFYLILNEAKQSEHLRHGLKKKGILAAFHYFPLHLSAMGRRFGYRKGDLPMSERMGDCLIRIPFYTSMTPREQQTVIGEIQRLL